VKSRFVDSGDDGRCPVLAAKDRTTEGPTTVAHGLRHRDDARVGHAAQAHIDAQQVEERCTSSGVESGPTGAKFAADPYREASSRCLKPRW
jgi:hypothetical protein